MPSGAAQRGERTRARQWYRKGASITHIAEQMDRPRETVRDWVADLRPTFGPVTTPQQNIKAAIKHVRKTYA